MRTTVTLDEDLLAEAADLTNISERKLLLRRALEALIAAESAKRLARLGSSDPKALAPDRRRLAG